MTPNEITERLFEMQDGEYRLFQAKLMPTVDPESIIGVRMPQIRAFAKELAKEDCTDFFDSLPHEYYDENNIHGTLISSIKDYSEAVRRVDAFLPYVDNWATCDIMTPRVFKKHLPELVPEIRRWMGSAHPYTVRFGIEMLMAFFLDGEFRPEYLEKVSVIRSDEYYVNMMIAWYFATALTKQYDAALPYIERQRLDTWTHNKAIQKALESYRISDERKAYLRTLKKR